MEELAARLDEHLRIDREAHARLDVRLEGIQSAVDQHAADTQVTAATVERMDRELFGDGSSESGLVKTVVRMGATLRVGVWLAATIGGATLTALVVLVFEILGRSP